MRSYRNWIVDKFIKLNEKYVFERRLRRFYLKKDVKFETIIDVGSNIGQMIDFILSINSDCKIYGFEPNGKLFKYLNLKYSSYINVNISRYGISDFTGHKRFYENIMDTTSTLEPVNMDSKYLKRKAMLLGVDIEHLIDDVYDVEVTTLCSFIEELDIKSLDLVKIDTEGHEYSCLKGLLHADLTTYPKRIQIENHNGDMYRNRFLEIDELLKEAGYRVEVKLKHGFGGVEDLIYIKSITNI